MNHLFIVGAQRSGSTYLYHQLNDHPQVVMAQPVRPEPKFFLNDEHYARGRSFYETQYFEDYPPGTRYLGEKSTSYIESQTAAKRIREYYPDARVLMVLRDPVLRAWSNYRFSVQHGLEPLDFEMALAVEPERLQDAAFATSVNPYAYRRRGHYIDYIEDYLKIFNVDQLCVLIFEEIVGNLVGVQSLYRWLGIDDSFASTSLGEVFNPGSQQAEMPTAALRDLALGYRQSLDRLEHCLGRPIDSWRRHWASL